jgi:NitT/TauT family transport system ATP-binding protein
VTQNIAQFDAAKRFTARYAEAEAPRAAGAAPVPDSMFRLEGVAKSYGGKHGRLTEALDSIDIEVKRGEFLAIVGPSGGGKSTLLQIIAGLTPASSGRVMLDGRPVTAPPPEAIYLFQQYSKSLFPWRTVGANVLFAFERRPDLSLREKRERARDYLAMVGLADFFDHYPWQLSGGMQQRVAIARALAAAPRALLMDEPFSAVDALTRLELQSLILDIWDKAEDLTVVLVTHDVDEAVYLADRVAVLSRRPSQIVRIFEPNLPRPRRAVETREDPIFLRYRHELLNLLLGNSI